MSHRKRALRRHRGRYHRRCRGPRSGTQIRRGRRHPVREGISPRHPPDRPQLRNRLCGPLFEPRNLTVRLCRRSSSLLLDFAGDHDVALNSGGKVVVATDNIAADRLQAIRARSLADGVPDVGLPDRAGLEAVAPMRRARPHCIPRIPPLSTTADWARPSSPTSAEAVARSASPPQSGESCPDPAPPGRPR